jgi:hypothetical protein
VIQRLGRAGIGDRENILVHLDHSDAPLPDLQLESQHFACLLVMDASKDPHRYRQMLCELVRRGAVYVSSWGPGCETAPDIVYAPDFKSDWHMMVSWHQDDPLEEAVSLFAAFPDASVIDACRSSVAVVVGKDREAEEVRRLLKAKGAV